MYTRSSVYFLNVDVPFLFLRVCFSYYSKNVAFHSFSLSKPSVSLTTHILGDLIVSHKTLTLFFLFFLIFSCCFFVWDLSKVLPSSWDILPFTSKKSVVVDFHCYFLFDRLNFSFIIFYFDFFSVCRLSSILDMNLFIS